MLLLILVRVPVVLAADKVAETKAETVRGRLGLKRDVTGWQFLPAVFCVG